MTKHGEVLIWNVTPMKPIQTAIPYANLRSQHIVAIECAHNHGIAISESGSVHSFMLSEAYTSNNSHISCAAAQYTLIEGFQTQTIKRTRILPMGQCNYPFNCNCCIVGLTFYGELYVCPMPSNQHGWFQQIRSCFIDGLEGINICRRKCVLQDSPLGFLF